MNSKEWMLLSSAALIGAWTSAVAVHFFYNRNRKKSIPKDPDANGDAVSERTTSTDPYNPSKRTGGPKILIARYMLGQPKWCDTRLGLDIMGSQEDALMTDSHGPSYVCHAEVNAILNTNLASAEGQKLYLTMFPCNECAKVIIQSGVSEVIYFVEKRIDSSDTCYIASHKLPSIAGVKARKHQLQMPQISIKFEEPWSKIYLLEWCCSKANGPGVVIL